VLWVRYLAIILGIQVVGDRLQVAGFLESAVFSVFFVPSVVKGFCCVKEIKDLTQRTQRHREPQRVLKRKKKCFT